MYEKRKIVCGTPRGLENTIKRHEETGWKVEHTEIVPRGTESKKFTYIAYLKREYKRLKPDET